MSIESATFTYEELEVKHQDPCRHSDLLRGIHVTTCQLQSLTDWHRALNTMLIRNSYKILAIRQKMDVPLCSNGAT